MFKNKKIIFIIPPVTEKIWSNYYPEIYLGIAYISRALKNHGHKVTILDYDVSNKSLSSISSKIGKLKPDYIGIASLYGSINNALKIAEKCKNNSNAKIVFGGIPATFIPEYILSHSYVDICVRGEGEVTFLEIINGKKLLEIKGISFKQNNEVIHNANREHLQNLDDLGIPLREIFPIKKYKLPFKIHNSTTIETSRGCPYGCDFCTQQPKEGAKLRFRSPKVVLKELEIISREHKNIKRIMFIDNDFLTNIKHAKDIFNLIIKHKLNDRFYFMFATRVANLARAENDFIMLLKRLNVTTIFFGIESLSDKYVKDIGKIKNKAETIEMFRKLEKMGIDTFPSYIIGYQDEIKKDINQTLEFAKILNTKLFSFNILTPYPGTRFFEYCHYNKLLLPTFEYNKLDNSNQVIVHKLNLEKEVSRMRRLYILRLEYIKKITILNFFNRQNAGRLSFFLYYIVFMEMATFTRKIKRCFKKMIFGDNCFEK